MPGMNGIEISMGSRFEDATECAVCGKNFHAFRRKHRCKSCGKAVCRACATAHKKMPQGGLIHSDEPVRICDICIQNERAEHLERMRQAEVENARARQLAEMEAAERRREAAEKAAQEELERKKKEEYNQLVRKHFGDALPTVTRRRSFDHIYPKSKIPGQYRQWLESVVERSNDIISMQGKPMITQVESVIEECAICLEVLEMGHAIFTTSCGHSFHWSCLKDIKSSHASNSDQCPSCRASMSDLQIKKACDHPRVRATHKFCRDCGEPVTAADVKQRVEEPTTTSMPSAASPAPGANGATYRAGSQGALVQCPQCRIQMRVLPHMYNMRVACPSGHMFQVQVAPSTQSSGRSMSSYSRNTTSGYPGSSSSSYFYRS
ncbi:hypothetical protein THRCLA_01744 [Thraustotheca clavata]|uniref:FYVE-type domain-containing protein n=1 Tax=Thraustotheca clavata TaxID=74557 RepID=A0A1W0A7C0_9STRA|nr:hypothetical protein THRCLA_01744 [Thraustotheca clavata]